MARKRQLILSMPDPEAEPGEIALLPLGRWGEVIERLGAFNTAGDGSSRSTGTEILHGPGYVVELAAGQEEVTQAMVIVHDEDLAWPVLSRLCRQTGWKMTDLESGRMFG